MNVNNKMERAFIRFNGTDKNGQTFWQVYHHVKGVGIWGAVIPGNEADAKAELAAAISEGRARKVAELFAA